jgi:predicted molibdopterin-dependent oxidoreductase YjgC
MTPGTELQMWPGTGRIRFDGRPVPFTDGQSVGAALWAAGVRSWRTTRVLGRPRGLFCGIGVCFDCLVEIDGRPDQRACVTPARDGMVVDPQEGTGRAGGGRS